MAVDLVGSLRVGWLRGEWWEDKWVRAGLGEGERVREESERHERVRGRLVGMAMEGTHQLQSHQLSSSASWGC